jgi:hypothetical protein
LRCSSCALPPDTSSINSGLHSISKPYMHVLLGFIALAIINAVGDNIAVSPITARLPCAYMTGCNMQGSPNRHGASNTFSQPVIIDPTHYSFLPSHELMGTVGEDLDHQVWYASPLSDGLNNIFDVFPIDLIKLISVNG